MRIGELARRAEVSVRSLRYYEEQGLLTSERGIGGQRHYAEHDVERVVFIQRLYAAGLSSRTIAEVMPCVESPGVDTSEAALERMRHERDRISRHIDELCQTRDNLDTLIAANREHRASLADPAQRTAAASTRARSTATS